MAEGGTIGRANVVLGVDTSQLDSGLSAAKAKVEADIAAMDELARVNLTAGGDEDAYEGALAAQEELRYRQTLAGLAERTQSETTSFLLEEQRYQETLRTINADVIAADAEKAAYQQTLFQLRKEQLMVENEITIAARDQAAAAKAAADAEAAAVAETAKKAAATAAHKTAMESIQNTTKDVVDEMPKMRPPPVAKQDWLDKLLGDSKEVNKSLQAFGKLAIFTTVAASAYALGQAIRENVIKQLKSGAEAAQEFRDSLNTTDINARLESTQKEVDGLNEKIAAQSGSWFASMLGTLAGESTATLEEKRNELQGDIGRMNRDRKAAADAAKKKEGLDKAQAIRYATEEERISRMTDERLAATSRYNLELQKLNDKIATEKNADVLKALEGQKRGLYEQYQVDAALAEEAHQKKLQDAADAIKKEEDQRKQKAKDNRELEYQLMDDQQQHAAKFLDDYAELEDQYRNAKDDQDRALIKRQMELRAQIFNKELADQQKELLKQQQEQFRELRGQISGLFDNQNLDLGINKLGTLLTTLVRQTGDNR